jgi:hypothetical protein
MNETVFFFNSVPLVIILFIFFKMVNISVKSLTYNVRSPEHKFISGVIIHFTDFIGLS